MKLQNHLFTVLIEFRQKTGRLGHVNFLVKVGIEEGGDGS
jgi:hypothetical protein